MSFGFYRQIYPVTAIVSLCLGVAACNHTSDGAGASLEQGIPASDMTGSIHSKAISMSEGGLASHAIVSLPEAAGRVTALNAHEYVNGIRQDISVGGGAFKTIHNGITILARTSQGQTLDEAVPLERPTEAMIRSEIGALFPHIAMSVVERESANSYGPYGLALGRTSGDIRCLYMWQWIDENRLPRESLVKSPLSIRVRLCQSGTTFDAMAGLVNQIRVNGPVSLVAESVNSKPVLAEMPPETRRAAHQKTAYHHDVAKHARREVSSEAGADHYLTSAAMAHTSPSVPQTGNASTPLVTPNDLPPEAYLGPRAPTSRPN